MSQVSLKNPPQVFVSSAATSAGVSRGVAASKLRKLGSRLYTTNLDEEPASLVRRHLWEVVRPEEGDEKGIRLRIPMQRTSTQRGLEKIPT
jgi:hypothetical protein